MNDGTDDAFETRTTRTPATTRSSELDTPSGGDVEAFILHQARPTSSVHTNKRPPRSRMNARAGAVIVISIVGEGSTFTPVHDTRRRARFGYREDLKPGEGLRGQSCSCFAQGGESLSLVPSWSVSVALAVTIGRV